MWEEGKSGVWERESDCGEGCGEGEGVEGNQLLHYSVG